MPQTLAGDADVDGRTETERQSFKLMLKNANLLYLSASVLILTDRSYLSRFWTNFEAWLAMQDVSMHGLVAARPANSRFTIRCVHGSPEALADSLVEEWAHCTALKAHQKLSSADVQVTNQSDKDIQLPKILELDQRVADVAIAIGLYREPSPDTPICQWPEPTEPLFERSRTF